jgi:hypothetical protein
VCVSRKISVCATVCVMCAIHPQQTSNILLVLCCSTKAALFNVGTKQCPDWRAKEKGQNRWVHFRGQAAPLSTKQDLCRMVYSQFGPAWQNRVSMLPVPQRVADRLVTRLRFKQSERDALPSCVEPSIPRFDYLHSFKSETDHCRAPEYRKFAESRANSEHKLVW